MTELELLKREEKRLNDIIDSNRDRQREICTEMFEKEHGVKVGDVAHIEKKGYSSEYTGRILRYIYGRDCCIKELVMCKITRNGKDHSVPNNVMIWNGTTITKV